MALAKDQIPNNTPNPQKAQIKATALPTPVFSLLPPQVPFIPHEIRLGPSLQQSAHPLNVINLEANDANQLPSSPPAQIISTVGKKKICIPLYIPSSRQLPNPSNSYCDECFAKF